MNTINLTNVYAEAMEKSIYLVHDANQLHLKGDQPEARNKMLSALVNFLSAISVIPVEDISTVIRHVGAMLERYWFVGTDEWNSDELERIIDNLILIKGREEFK